MSERAEPPHYCPKGCVKKHRPSQLRKLEVLNCAAEPTGRSAGHVWECPQCGDQFVGYGDPAEWEPTP